MLTQEIDEELVLFLEIGRLHKGSDNIVNQTTMSSQRCPLRRTAADNFLYSDNDKSDYDWLVTPPGSPRGSLMDQHANPMALKSELGNWQEEEENDKISSNSPTSSFELSSSVTSVSRIRRPSSSCSSRSTSRPSTPTRKSTTATRVTLTTRPSSSSSSMSSSRPSTPIRRSTTAARVTLTSKPSSTCTSRSTSRPSTPTSRPSSSSGTSRVTSTSRQTTGSASSTRSNTRPISVPSTKPGSRSSTPVRRPSTPTGNSNGLRKLTKPALSQGASPILRSRPWEPHEMPGFSLEAPSNLRTTLPDRPQTASGRRISAFGGASRSSRSASIERVVARKQSCSPSRSRAPIGNGTVPSLRGQRAKTSNDSVGLISPVAMENQMVERAVNMRKRAPSPRLTESGGRRVGGGGGSSAGKSSSVTDGFGFSRNISKSSIDMAVRHMDVKRGSMKGNFRPSLTKVPATSVSNVISSGTRRNRPVSSSGSSESSINILCLDGSDDNLSERSHS